MTTASAVRGASRAEESAMRRALALAATSGVPLGPNPRVGCVLLGPDGDEIAAGHHRGAGHPHAEVEALRSAGRAARGATAVVTLEPCDHTGRTGPCSDALLAAGVRRVVLAMPDPNPTAAGGALRLRREGVEVVEGVCADDAARLNRGWLFGLRHARPFVTWKVAGTLDGRCAAPDGSSRWITGRSARLDTHRLRAACDVVMAGTGTVLADDSHLAVRDEAGEPVAHQPLRVVVGERDLPPGSRVLDDAAETLHLRTHEPAEVLERLFALGRRHVFLEGGPTLAAAFVRDGLVDEVVAYVAPVLLGSAGAPAVGDLGIGSIDEALRLDVTDVTVLETWDAEPAPGGSSTDIRITMAPRGARTTQTAPQEAH